MQQAIKEGARIVNLKKLTYYLGIAFCFASFIAACISLISDLSITIALWSMIVSNVCRIVSLEVEITEIQIEIHHQQ